MRVEHPADCSVVVAHGAKELEVIFDSDIIYEAGIYGLVSINMATSIVKWISLLVWSSLSDSALTIFVV